MKKTMLTALLLVGSVCVWAQDTEGEAGGESKLFAGGNFGLSLGSYTLISLNPQVGYRFNRFLAGGLGLNLLYTSQKEKDVYGNDYSKVVQGITGLNTFLRFFPVRQIVLQVQPEANYIFGKQIFYQPVKETYKLDTEIIPSFLVGGGLVTSAGQGSMLFTVMYDILQNNNSPYGSQPFIQVGYNFNF